MFEGLLRSSGRLLAPMTAIVVLLAGFGGTPAALAQAGWTPFGELPGADAYRDVARNARRIGLGGRVRDIRFDETHAYFLSGDGWQRVDLATGERTEADAKAPNRIPQNCK